MRETLKIGDTAKLVGVTPKAIRHYHKLGLLAEPPRSEGGYRLYSADDLLRLRRIRRLKSLGLPLRRIKDILGDPDGDGSLRFVLGALLAEVESDISRLEERRERLRNLLVLEDLEAEESATFALVKERMGEHLADVSPELLEQERKVWAILDAFEWPEGYEKGREALLRYYETAPEDFAATLPVGERFAALAGAPEDSPEVERAAEDMYRYLVENPPPEGAFEEPPWTEGPLGEVMSELMASTLSPAQRRVMDLVAERIEDHAAREAKLEAEREPDKRRRS